MSMLVQILTKVLALLFVRCFKQLQSLIDFSNPQPGFSLVEPFERATDLVEVFLEMILIEDFTSLVCGGDLRDDVPHSVMPIC